MYWKNIFLLIQISIVQWFNFRNKKIHVILFLTFWLFQLPTEFHTFQYRLSTYKKQFRAVMVVYMCLCVCVYMRIDSQSYPRNICTLGIELSISSREQIYLRENVKWLFLSERASVQPCEIGIRRRTRRRKGGNKHLRAPQTRIILRDFSKMRRRG